MILMPGAIRQTVGVGQIVAVVQIGARSAVAMICTTVTIVNW